MGESEEYTADLNLNYTIFEKIVLQLHFRNTTAGGVVPSEQSGVSDGLEATMWAKFMELITYVGSALYQLLSGQVVGFFMFCFMLYFFMKRLDPTAQQKKEAKTKALKIMDKLGLNGFDLTPYELIIASNLIDPSDINVGWSDVGGLGHIISEMKSIIINPLLARQKLVQLSKFVQPPKGVLLFGPPGCGKTLLAKALSRESGCWFINLEISSLFDKYYGETEKRVRAVFSLAAKIQPCIIFFDEIDSLLRSRSSKDHEATAMMKAQFMTLWDGLITDSNHSIIVVGATNRQKDLDKAILRRMDAKFYVPLPGPAERKDILKLALRNENVSRDVNYKLLAQLSVGFSGSDIKDLIRTAVLACFADFNMANLPDKPKKQNLAQGNGKTKRRSKISSAFVILFRILLFPLHMFDVFDLQVDVNSPTTPCETLNADPTVEEKGADNIKLRSITMKDLETAIQKMKLSKARCSSSSSSPIHLSHDIELQPVVVYENPERQNFDN